VGNLAGDRDDTCLRCRDKRVGFPGSAVGSAGVPSLILATAIVAAGAMLCWCDTLKKRVNHLLCFSLKMSSLEAI
jgi:hypothetical protein